MRSNIKALGVLTENVKKHGKLLSGVAVGLIVGGGSMVTFASIPDSNNVIHACYTTGLGASVRIIDDSSDTCTGGETAISWDKQSGSKSVLIDSTSGGDFSNGNYVGWNLNNTDFSDANFTGARLSKSSFIGADLTGVNFTATDLTGVDMEGFDLHGATIGDTYFTGSNFQSVNLSNSNFGGGMYSSGGNFTGADFSGSNIWNGFDTMNLSNTDFSDTVFAPFGGFGSSEIDIFGVNFTNADFTNVQFTTDPSYRIVFSGTDFTGTDLSDPDVSRVFWGEDTTCPDGTISGDNSNTCVGHLVP